MRRGAPVLVPILLGLGLILTFGLALALGSSNFSPAVLWGALTGEAEPWQRAVLFGVRAPRVLVAALGGAGLAAAGAGMQGLFRNPLADPGILGVSGGASFGAVLALYLGGAVGGVVGGVVGGAGAGAGLTYGWALVPLSAFLGALGCAWLVYAMATRRGRAPMASLLLAGVAVAGVATALTTFVLSLSLSRWELAQQMLSWLMGGLEGRTFRHAAVVLPPTLIGLLALLYASRELDALALGEESAASVGVDVPRLKRWVLAVASLMTAATVSVMGNVAFVGLMVPHIARALVGPSHRRLLPSAAILGAVFMVLADLVCRLLAESIDLRPGVISALAGGPFFLWLLIRARGALGLR